MSYVLFQWKRPTVGGKRSPNKELCILFLLLMIIHQTQKMPLY
jgi:hypothetical protein